MRRINIRDFPFQSWWICQIWWKVTITYEGIEWVINVANTYLWLLLAKFTFHLSCPFTQMCIFKFFTWWLLSITLVVASGFFPQKFRRWQGPTNGTLHMNVGSVAGIPWGGRTQNPTFLQKNLFEYFALTGRGDPKTSDADTWAASLASEPRGGTSTK